MDVRTEPPRVALIGADPLARAGLRAALSACGVDVIQALDPADLGSLFDDDLDALVWDDGPRGAETLPEALPAPVLALVGDGDRARAWLSAGAGGALLRDGDGPRMAAALAALEAGLLVLDLSLGAALVAAAAPPGEATPPDWLDPLSARESEVLELVAEGFSNKEIGAQLGISPHTAKFHVNTLLTKLDAQTRTEAVVRAARAGLLSL